MVERSLSTLVQPCFMSQLLQQCGRVSDFGPGGLGSISSRGIGDKHFSTLLIETKVKLSLDVAHMGVPY